MNEVPTITSSQNPQVSRVRRYLSRPRECRRNGVLIADGIHLVQEALAVGLSCRAMFAEEQSRDPEVSEIVATARERRLPLYPVVPHIFRAMSPVETPQGILGVFERPRHERAEVWKRVTDPQGPGHIAIAVGIQDPSNLGSIARSGLAAGIRALICTEETVDPYHHRALRAAMGASFRLPILTEEPLEPLITTVRNLGLRTAGLSPRGGVDIYSLDPGEPLALLLGSEGSGLPTEAESDLDLHVRIPTAPAVESLGVAAAAAVAFFSLCRP